MRFRPAVLAKLRDRLAVVVLSAGLTLLLAACATSPAATPVGASRPACRLSPAPAVASAPMAHGRILSFANGRSHLGVDTDPAIQHYLDTIAAPLRSVYGSTTDLPPVFAVLDLGYNAWATDDGRVYIATGVLERARADDEVAALVAHEFGHLACGHASTSLRMGGSEVAVGALAWVSVFSGVPAVAGLSLVGQDAANDYTHAGFSRMQELEADANAVDALASAGYSPAGLSEMMRKLASAPPPPPNALPIVSEFQGAAHPGTEDRATAYKAIWNERYPNVRQPATHARLDAMRELARNHLRCTDEAALAYRDLGYPFGLLGHPELAGDRAATSRAEQHVRRCHDPSAPLAVARDPGPLVLSTLPPDLQALWHVRLVVAETRARRGLVDWKTEDERGVILRALLSPPEAPQVFILQSTVLTARVLHIDEAKGLMQLMEQRYGDDPALYPLAVAIDTLGVAVANRQPKRQGFSIQFPTARCVLWVKVLEACGAAQRDPVRTLNELWLQLTGTSMPRI